MLHIATYRAHTHAHFQRHGRPHGELPQEEPAMRGTEVKT